ncbi:FAD-dependent oxidoreductase [Gynuella sp.]|uniref:oxidoreductase n=1 Tax=Gynuella sp. TaxID=2969146 RepID=UPI003D153018
MSSQYPQLLSSIQVGHKLIRNRIIMGSMHTGLEEAPGGFERLAVFYRERAKGQVGLIITGGIAPNNEGRVAAHGAKMASQEDVDNHKIITSAVHAEGASICMQILHTGRYSYQPDQVSASAIKAPINPFTPKALSSDEVEQQIQDFARAAKLAQQAGYDGVEVMGSEGYFINQFIASRTNQREDHWGGSFSNRCRLAISIVKAIREACGDEFLIIFRLSLIDLVEDGCEWHEVVQLGQWIQEAGANLINSGIGWHESRVPTIATSVPRAAFVSLTARMKEHLDIPIVATNRINTPEVGEEILLAGHADMICMARPFLADPDFVIKVSTGKADLINTCIACNQACLDHIFEMKTTSCLVNPRACHETLLQYVPVTLPKKVAVIGAGPAGLSASVVAAERGHRVTLFEASEQIGGQFNIAKRIPGKAEFQETLRYYSRMLDETGVELRLNTYVQAEQLSNEGFEEVIVATGILPRLLDIPGIDHPTVTNYLEVLTGKVEVNGSVAIIGAGGIGFDVAEFIAHKNQDCSVQTFAEQWGIDLTVKSAGGLQPPKPAHALQQIIMLQRKTGSLGQTLGKTTGWIHKSGLKKAGVRMLSGVTYLKIDDQGLHVEIENEVSVLSVDHIVICAGQEPDQRLFEALSLYPSIHSVAVGGARKAGELDAKRAIREGAEIAASI